MTRCAKATDAGITTSQLLMKILANPQSPLAGKWLVITQMAGCAISSDLASIDSSPNRMASGFIGSVSGVLL